MEWTGRPYGIWVANTLLALGLVALVATNMRLQVTPQDVYRRLEALENRLSDEIADYQSRMESDIEVATARVVKTTAEAIAGVNDEDRWSGTAHNEWFERVLRANPDLVDPDE